MSKYFVTINNWWKHESGDFVLFSVSWEWRKGFYYIGSIFIADIEIRFGWDVDE